MRDAGVDQVALPRVAQGLTADEVQTIAESALCPQCKHHLCFSMPYTTTRHASCRVKGCECWSRYHRLAVGRDL